VRLAGRLRPACHSNDLVFRAARRCCMHAMCAGRAGEPPRADHLLDGVDSGSVSQYGVPPCLASRLALESCAACWLAMLSHTALLPCRCCCC
jgi:hypothetical protein